MFVKDEVVIVHSLGDGEEYKAVVKGVSTYNPEGSIMIIKMIDRFRNSKNYLYEYCCVSENCLRKINKGTPKGTKK